MKLRVDGSTPWARYDLILAFLEQGRQESVSFSDPSTAGFLGSLVKDLITYNLSHKPLIGRYIFLG